MIQAKPSVDPKLAAAIRAVVFRESGRAPLSVVISTLRNNGWTKLGSTNEFTNKCEQAGFLIEHQYKKDAPQVVTRTFVKLNEEEFV